MISDRVRAVVLTVSGLVVCAVLSACASASATPADGPPPPTGAELEATQHALDARAASAPAAVTSWGIDPAAERVVVTVSGPRTSEIDRFLTGLDPRTLRIDTMAPPIRTLPATSSQRTTTFG